MDINKKVLLLAIYKREDDESLNDILLKMDSTHVFSQKEGKKYLKELKKEQLISENSLTVLGITKAKEVELEFKI